MYWITDHRLHEREIMMRAHQRDDLKDKHQWIDGCGILGNCKHTQWDQLRAQIYGCLCILYVQWVCVLEKKSNTISVEYKPSMYVQVLTQTHSCVCVCVWDAWSLKKTQTGNKESTRYPKCIGSNSRELKAVLRLLLKITLMSHASVDLICHHLCARVKLNETETQQTIRYTKRHLRINTHLDSLCVVTHAHAHIMQMHAHTHTHRRSNPWATWTYLICLSFSRGINFSLLICSVSLDQISSVYFSLWGPSPVWQCESTATSEPRQEQILGLDPGGRRRMICSTSFMTKKPSNLVFKIGFLQDFLALSHTLKPLKQH